MTFLSYIEREFTQLFLIDANHIPYADQFIYKHGNGYEFHEINLLKFMCNWISKKSFYFYLQRDFKYKF